MRPTKILLAATAIWLSAASLPAAAAVILSADQGWYNSSGYHSPSNNNIAVGNNDGYRNFFAFNLGTISGTITGASLKIYGGNGAYYNGANTSEIYNIYDYTGNKVPMLSGFGGTAAYNDLGSGSLYGSTTVNYLLGSAGPMHEVTIASLSAAAISDMNAALAGTDHLFIIGGASPSLLAGQYLWSGSGSTPAAELSIEVQPATAVPTPDTLPLIAAGGLGLLFFRRHRPRNSDRAAD